MPCCLAAIRQFSFCDHLTRDLRHQREWIGSLNIGILKPTGRNFDMGLLEFPRGFFDSGVGFRIPPRTKSGGERDRFG